MDIEAQKERQLTTYHSNENIGGQDHFEYPAEMQLKFCNLLSQISVNEIQQFPSHLLIRALTKVGYKFFQEAIGFWKLMNQVDPQLKFEMVLMDFLFDRESKSPVRREQATMTASLLVDMQEDFRDRVRRDFLAMVLRNENCQKLLQIQAPPADFPIVTIKAPVPWKCAIQLAKNRLDQVLMTCHPVLQAINMLWHELYNDLIVVNTKRVHRSEIAPDASELTNLIEKCCSIARDVSKIDCCAQIIISYSHWRRHDYNPFNHKLEIMFSCRISTVTPCISKTSCIFYVPDPFKRLAPQSSRSN